MGTSNSQYHCAMFIGDSARLVSCKSPTSYTPAEDPCSGRPNSMHSSVIAPQSETTILERPALWCDDHVYNDQGVQFGYYSCYPCCGWMQACCLHGTQACSASSLMRTDSPPRSYHGVNAASLYSQEPSRFFERWAPQGALDLSDERPLELEQKYEQAQTGLEWWSQPCHSYDVHGTRFEASHATSSNISQGDCWFQQRSTPCQSFDRSLYEQQPVRTERTKIDGGTVQNAKVVFACKVPHCDKSFSMRRRLYEHYWTHLDESTRSRRNAKVTLQNLRRILLPDDQLFFDKLTMRLQNGYKKQMRSRRG